MPNVHFVPEPVVKLMKQEAAEMVIVAIRKILKGEIYLSDHMVSQTVHKFIDDWSDLSKNPVESLSDRELEVFCLIGRGLETRQIGERLHLSPKTVETYRTHIKEKLQITSSTELAQQAFQWIKDESGSSW